MRVPEILLVEDNPGDIRLTQEALKESNFNSTLNVVVDGEEALEYLFKRGKFTAAESPDLILLDLNLPKKSGLEVLEEIKNDPELRIIPSIILTTSDNERDIIKSYKLHANCYIIKPVDFDEFARLTKLIESFWFNSVKLPETQH
ncbi:MAG: response regulator [Chitinophagales bacterium]|nr:response regulator [Chitinophagales bacterium]